MNIMLLAVFAAVGLGLFARNFGARENWLALAIAVALTAAYFIHPTFIT